MLADLKSTNGTRVDGKLITASWNLRDGEKIFVGESILTFTEASDTDLVYLRDPVMQTGTDSLTGLESKRRFDDALDTALVSARLINSPLALLAMDLDGLQAIGELHGHPFSTHCIRETGRIIDKKVGASGYACRYGGDDFIAFLKGTNRQNASRIAEDIRTAIESADIRKEGISLNPTISIGIAVFPDDGSRVLDLTAIADQALYRAKAAGKNRVVAR